MERAVGHADKSSIADSGTTTGFMCASFLGFGSLVMASRASIKGSCLAAVEV